MSCGTAHGNENGHTVPERARRTGPQLPVADIENEEGADRHEIGPGPAHPRDRPGRGEGFPGVLPADRQSPVGVRHGKGRIRFSPPKEMISRRAWLARAAAGGTVLALGM